MNPTEARLRALETSARPVSADELTGVFIELRAAAPRTGVPQPTLDRFRQVLEKSIDGALAQARAEPLPTDFRSIQAENVGKLVVLARGCLEHRHQPPACADGLTGDWLAEEPHCNYKPPMRVTERPTLAA